MGSIPKIVSTPLKWVSKKVVHKTLLRFPGGDEHSPIACTYCPEMCRFSCPTAVASGNDAVTPCNKNSLLYKEEKWPGKSAGGGPLWTIYDCTGCGRCTEYCVYGMPVAKMLFEARGKYKWENAEKAAASLSDGQDRVGDLAHELGDQASAERRLGAFAGAARTVVEPKELHFAAAHGKPLELSWERFLSAPLDAEGARRLAQALGARRWLLHESVWLSRNLERAAEVQAWIERVRALGVQIVRPFHQGKDCIDCGGEGAYPLLFGAQAATIARDYWERDRDRADGILTMSARCRKHFASALGASVPVLSVPEVFGVQA